MGLRKERHLQDIKNLSRSFIKLKIFFDSFLWIELHHKNNPLPSLILTLISNQGAWVETLGNRWGGVCHLAASKWRTLTLHSNRISHDSALHFVSTCQLLCPLTCPSLSRRSLIKPVFETVFFLEQFKIQRKFGSHRDSPHTPCPHTCTASSVINIPHQSAAFVAFGEPAHHYHSKFIVYIRVHSW